MIAEAQCNCSRVVQVATKTLINNRCRLVLPGEEHKLSIKDLVVQELGTATHPDVVMDACWEVLKELQSREWHSQLLPPRNHWFEAFAGHALL